MGAVKRYIDADAFIADTQKRYCEDCEHRKGVKNGQKRFVFEIGGVRCRSCDIGDMIDAVDDFPAADVAPVVHGHWENKYERHYIFFGTCSVCKHVCQENYICGNCGAKMDEREDSGND